MPSTQFNDLKEAPSTSPGGGSGIGAAITEGFVAQGAKVAFIGRSDRRVSPLIWLKNMTTLRYSFKETSPTRARSKPAWQRPKRRMAPSPA